MEEYFLALLGNQITYLLFALVGFLIGIAFIYINEISHKKRKGKKEKKKKESKKIGKKSRVYIFLLCFVLFSVIVGPIVPELVLLIFVGLAGLAFGTCITMFIGIMFGSISMESPSLKGNGDDGGIDFGGDRGSDSGSDGGGFDGGGGDSGGGGAGD